MRPFRNVVQTLAASFLAGKFDGPGLLQRSRPLLSRHRTWLPKLIKRVIDQFGEVSRPRRAKLIKFLLADEPLRMVWEKSSFELKQQFVRPEFIVPDDVRATWAVPKWATIGELATWLGLETNELA